MAHIFDSKQFWLRHKRARKQGKDGLFLHQAVAEIVQERLSEINKSFHNIAIIGADAEYWQAFISPNAQLIRESDVLEIKQAHYDLLISALHLHRSNDVVGQLIQMRRALKADGLMIASLFGGQSLNELRSVFAEAETNIMGGISPHIAPMGELRDLGALLQRAGFALPVADHHEFKVSYKNARALMHDLRAMGETNIMLERRKKMMRRDVLSALESLYQEHFPDKDNRIMATFDVVFLTGWQPDETQQKPLRPGSAQMRLADALGATEMGLE